MASSDDDVVITSENDMVWQQSNQRKRERASSIEVDYEVPPIPIPRKRKTTPKVPRLPCDICFEDISLKSIIRLNCDCQSPVCRACFNSWVSHSGDLPECCDTKMEYDDYQHVLSATNKRNIKLRADEKADTDPVYCYTCQEYLKRTNGNDGFGTCGKCKTKTCRVCRSLKQDHFGIHSICPENMDEPALEELSTQLGWKRCPKCFARIEKTVGCDGMRCICGCDFMYCCGQKRQQCHCQSEAEEAPWG